MKTEPQRSSLVEEVKLDEQLRESHEKKVYSFTDQEKKDLHTVELMTGYLQLVERMKSNQVIIEALARVGKNLDERAQTIYSLKDGVFIHYTPKK